MKKFTKISLILATILIVTGIIVTCVSFNYMARDKNYTSKLNFKSGINITNAGIQIGDMILIDENGVQLGNGANNNSNGNVVAGDLTKEYVEKNFEIPLNEIDSIVIDGSNKKVKFLHSEDNIITVNYFENVDDRYSISDDKETLYIENIREKKIFNLFPFNPPSVSSTITVYLPERYDGNISVDTSNGAIEISEYKDLDDVYLKSSNGSITVEDLSSDSLVAESSNGAIKCTTVVSEELSIKTSNATINITDITSEDIILRTSNGSIDGNIKGEKSEYTITSKTSNGRNTLSNSHGGEKTLDVKTSNASINITFN